MGTPVADGLTDRRLNLMFVDLMEMMVRGPRIEVASVAVRFWKLVPSNYSSLISQFIEKEMATLATP